MKVRMCPYCDHEMTKRHHCDVCNSFVWKAEMVDIHFNSQSRGRNEADCAYGAAHDQAHHAAAGAGTKSGSSKAANMPGNPRETAKRPQNMPEYSWKAAKSPLETDKRPQETADKHKVLSAVFVVVAAAVIFLAPQISKIADWVMDSIASIGAGGDTTVSETADLSGYKMLAPEDIVGINVPCTTYSHMELSGTDVASMCLAFLDAFAPDSTLEQSKYFQGYAMEDGSGQILYENVYSMELDGGLTEYIAVSADAVTDSVHFVTIQMKDKALVRALIKNFLAYWAGIKEVTDADMDLLFELDDQNYGHGFCKNYEMNIIYRPLDEAYSASIYHNAYPQESCIFLREQEISSEQIASEAVECTAVPHFTSDIHGAQAAELINHWLDTNNYHGLVMEELQENRAAVYQQLADLEYEVLDYEHEYFWGSNETQYSIHLNTDSYSDRIHDIRFVSFTKDDISNLMALVTQILGFGDAADFTERCMEEYESEGYCFWRVNGYKLYISGDDEDDLYIYVTPMT